MAWQHKKPARSVLWQPLATIESFLGNMSEHRMELDCFADRPGFGTRNTKDSHSKRNWTIYVSLWTQHPPIRLFGFHSISNTGSPNPNDVICTFNLGPTRESKYLNFANWHEIQNACWTSHLIWNFCMPDATVNSHAKAPLSSFGIRNCTGLLVERPRLVCGRFDRWIEFTTLVSTTQHWFQEAQGYINKRQEWSQKKRNFSHWNKLALHWQLSWLTCRRAASMTEHEKFHVLPTPCTLFKWSMLASSLDCSLHFRSLDVTYCTKLRQVLS